MTRETPDFSFLSGNPLSVIRNPSDAYTVRAGSSFELRVTISNQGSLSAIIDIYIDDEASQQVRQWCASPNERLALSPNSTSEVVFQFQVPPQTLPGNYTYRLIVDSPEHYPEHTPIRCLQPLQVLPAIESAVQVSDPTFTVSPASSSTESLTLQPGQLLQVSVLVDNRSNRVDRFWLSCPDLEESWFAVRYPEGLQLSGVVTTDDGLDLNPGAKGEILLFLNPSLNAVAGNYCATLRLQSANNPDWVLLDAVYLQILPVYLIDVELRTVLGKVRRLAGLFEVRLTNEGNTPRGIIVQIRSLEEEELCSYTLEPTVIWVLPRATANNVPTDARTPGDYVFELTGVSQKESGEITISTKTDTIKIKPNIVPLKIVQLKVNDQAADTKYFIPLNPIKPIKFVTIFWQVEGGKDMKVELLPSPGNIPPVGCIIYPLSQQPSSQTLTLKGTDGAGQKISQSVTFETLNRKEGDASTAVHFLRVKETAKKDTYFKTDWRRQAEDLKDDQKYRATSDKKYPIKNIKKFDNSKEKDSQTQEQLRDYWFVEFENKYKGKREWYIYKPNFEEVKCCTLNLQ